MRANIVKADYLSNYYAASGSGDQELVNDVVYNEIASLIDRKPLILISTISSLGFETKKIKTKRDLINKVAKLLQESERFRVAVVLLSSIDNGIMSVKEAERAAKGDYSVLAKKIGSPGSATYKNEGGGGAAGGGDFITAIIGAVGNITSSSLNLAAAKANNKTASEVSKSNLAVAKTNAESNLAVAEQNTKSELLKTLGVKISSGGQAVGTNVIIAIGLVGVVIIAGLYIYSMRNEKPEIAMQPATIAPPMANGGEIKPEIATIIDEVSNS